MCRNSCGKSGLAALSWRRTAHPSLRTLPLNHKSGCPILPRFWEGWATTKARPALALAFLPVIPIRESAFPSIQPTPSHENQGQPPPTRIPTQSTIVSCPPKPNPHPPKPPPPPFTRPWRGRPAPRAQPPAIGKDSKPSSSNGNPRKAHPPPSQRCPCFLPIKKSSAWARMPSP